MCFLIVVVHFLLKTFRYMNLSVTFPSASPNLTILTQSYDYCPLKGWFLVCYMYKGRIHEKYITVEPHYKVTWIGNKQKQGTFVGSSSLFLFTPIQWNLVITRSLGPWKITLLYRVSHYIRVKKQIQRAGTSKITLL